jgi:glycosyltransferase involved in cell wall biosynthesis
VTHLLRWFEMDTSYYARISRCLSKDIWLGIIVMKIGILAQLLSFRSGYRQAGVSRYIEYLLRNLPEILAEDETLTAFISDAASGACSSERFSKKIGWKRTSWPTQKVPVRILWEQMVAPFPGMTDPLDVVHGPVNIVPLGSRTPSVVTIHDLAFLEYPEQYPSLQRWYLNAMTRASARKAKRVIAVSAYTGHDIAFRLGVDPRKIVTVPNGVSDEFFPRKGTDELERFRREQELPDDFLLFVGTLQPRKNLIGLIRAYAQLSADERLPLYIVGGEGWMYSEIFAEANRLHVGADVHFPGYAASETLPLWYSASTAFIYPSFYEGFGLPVLEAMACGTPVVTSNRSSLPEVAGQAGLLVNPDLPDHIADAIRRLVHDTELRSTMAEAGREQASQYTWQRTARETLSVYRDVVNEG